MKTFLLSFVLPIVIIFFAFTISFVVGFLAFALVLLWTAWNFRAEIYTPIAQKKFQQSHSDGYKWFEKALNTGKMRPYNVLFYAYMLLRDGELDKAETLINKTTYMHKDKISADVKISANLNLALIKWKRGKLPVAIADLEELYNDGHKSSVLYGTLGYLYIIHGDIDKAYRFNKEAFEYNDTDNIVADNWGNSLYLKGEMDSAYEIYEALMEKNPKFMEAYYNFALVLDAKGEKDRAIDMLEKTLTMEEKYLSELTHEKVRTALAEMR